MKEASAKSKFIRLMISQGISLAGSSVVSLAIMWYVTLKTGSGSVAAAVTVTTYLPQVIVLLPGGILADRFSAKHISMLSDGAIAFSTLVLMCLFFAGFDSIGLILFFNTLRSLGTGIQMPACKSLLPKIVPEDKLLKANSINTGIWSITQLVSPGLGGILLNYWSLEYVFLLDIITAIIGIGILGSIQFGNSFHQENPESQQDTTISTIQHVSSFKTMWQEVADGFLYIRQNRMLTRSLVFLFLMQFLVVPAGQLTPLLAVRNLGDKISILSLIETAFSVGAFVISIFMSIKEIKLPHFKLIGIASILFGATMILVLTTHRVPVFLAFMFLMGIGSPLYYTPLMTLIQENTDSSYIGRVFSYADLISTLSMPLGMMLFGPLANISILIPFLIPGILLILLGLSCLRR